ncbi:hypothetical protein KJ762_01395 [bacterium]|nr:hypothetical protein [bacterium]MBU1065148.1 hypothetical protein [bacterium]MBU1633143.1 hypothetical protein [bacterium]MBU1872323.1 hypothetical protein [bacterium]
MKAYLAGAIEHAPDKGKAWRADLAEFLQIEFGHESYNPHIEEPKILTPEERKQFHVLKTENLLEFQKIVRKLIRNDIKSILTEIDYVICLWNEHAEKGGGTYGELTFAFYHGIPVYMVTPMELANISGWILGCTTEFFKNFDELKEFLRKKY